MHACAHTDPCAKVFAPLLSERFGPLSDDASCNMLACYGVDGGNFPVHIDNHGGNDRRVLTLIYYLNPAYDAARQGGCFVPYSINADAPPKSSPPVMLSAEEHLTPLAPIEPQSDRLVAFWTCELPHAVEEFRAQYGKRDGRYAITVWLTAEQGSQVFEQGRRILSPTSAHDARAVEERERKNQQNDAATNQRGDDAGGQQASTRPASTAAPERSPPAPSPASPQPHFLFVVVAETGVKREGVAADI